MASVTFDGRRWEVRRLRYPPEFGGRIALVLWIDRDDHVKATSNIPEEPLAPNEVIIKDYSENTGVWQALLDAGVIEDTGRRVKSGYVEMPIGRLLPKCSACGGTGFMPGDPTAPSNSILRCEVPCPECNEEAI